MEKIFHILVNLSKIHPIWFWSLIIGSFLLITLIYALIKFMLRYYSRKHDKVNHSFSGEVDAEGSVKKTYQCQKRFLFQRKEVIILGIIMTVVVPAGIYTAHHFISSSVAVDENTSLTKSKYVFGIDISHHQKKIDWDEVRNSKHPIDFIFMKATEGRSFKDSRFKENWSNARKLGYICGAYHFYSPDESTTLQFENYSETVLLQSGDMVPILDIEKTGKSGIKNLREGVLNWLKLAEEKYGVKPIIYTGRKFYKNYLQGYVDDYPLWIASYSGKNKLEGIDWSFHQFTMDVKVNGIKTKVDGNDFNGELEDLKKMCMP